MTTVQYPRAHAIRHSGQVHDRELLDVYTPNDTSESVLDRKSVTAIAVGIDTVRNAVFVDIDGASVQFTRRESDLLQDRGGAYLTKRDALDGPQVGPTE